MTVNYKHGLALVSVLLGLCLFFTPASAEFFIKGMDLTEDEFKEYILTNEPEYLEESIIFFHDPNCGSCIPAHEFLEEYLLEYPDTELLMISLADGTESREMFDEMKAKFERNPVFVPVLYIGPVALEGYDEIKDYFEETYQWYIQSKPE